MCGCVVCQRKGTLIGKLIYSGHKWRMGFGTLRLNHEPNGSHLGCVGSWRLTPPRLLWKNWKPVIFKYEQALGWGQAGLKSREKRRMSPPMPAFFCKTSWILPASFHKLIERDFLLRDPNRLIERDLENASCVYSPETLRGTCRFWASPSIGAAARSPLLQRPRALRKSSASWRQGSHSQKQHRPWQDIKSDVPSRQVWDREV